MKHLEQFLFNHADDESTHGMREAWLARLAQICRDPEWLSEALGPDAFDTRSQWATQAEIVGDAVYAATTLEPTDLCLAQTMRLGRLMTDQAINYFAPECARYALDWWQDYNDICGG